MNIDSHGVQTPEFRFSNHCIFTRFSGVSVLKVPLDRRCEVILVIHPVTPAVFTGTFRICQYQDLGQEHHYKHQARVHCQTLKVYQNVACFNISHLSEL